MAIKREKIGEAKVEVTPDRGMVVSGDVNVFKSPTYVNLQFVPSRIKDTRDTGVMTVDGRRVLLDISVEGYVTGIEIV
jgi:hypothetical protein